MGVGEVAIDCLGNPRHAQRVVVLVCQNNRIVFGEGLDGFKDEEIVYRDKMKVEGR